MEVKFSDGMRFMKCFCLFSSCYIHTRVSPSYWYRTQGKLGSSAP